MPDFAIIVSIDKQLFWHYSLKHDGMLFSSSEKYNTAVAAFAAAMIKANQRGFPHV